MKKYCPIIVLLTIICTLSGFLKSAYAESLNNNAASIVDREVSRAIKDKKVKGAIVSLVQDEKVILCKGYGFADENNDLTADGVNTPFRIGSISKTFVAIAAMQLYSAGKLDTDADISKYLEPDFPKFTYPITMKNLLTHTAGFEDMISGIAIDDVNKAEPLSESIRKYMPKQVFKPLEVESYSNYGIALAAYVIERITGQSFYEYAQEKIFTPLHMDKTTFTLKPLTPQVSKGYGKNGTEQFEPLINMYPEGSVTSTAEDMANYMINFMNGTTDAVTVKERDEILKQQFTMDEELSGIGYTWNRHHRNGSLFYDKKGETYNFFSRIITFPEKKVGVFISFNTSGTEGLLDEISEKVTDTILGKEKEKQAYAGKDLHDISGYYISTRTAFKSPEKFLNFLVSERTFKITGTAEDGFKLNGEKFTPVGKDVYNSPIGYFKVINRNGKTYFAVNSSFSYFRTDWYEYSGWQTLILILFTVFSFIIFLLSIGKLIFAIKKQTDKQYSIISNIPHILTFIILAVMILQVISSLSTNVEGMLIFLRVAAILVTISGFLGIISVFVLWNKKGSIFIKLFYSFWGISYLMFIGWMYLVNLIV